MATLKDTVDSISLNAVITKSVVKQAARRLREDGQLPSSCGSVPAHLNCKHVALLLLASLTATSAGAASRNALEYAHLTAYGRNGVDLEPGETQRTLLDQLAFFIDQTWRNTGPPHHPFENMTLDLTSPAGSVKVARTTANGELCLNLVFVEPGDDPDLWAAQRVRYEVTLPRQSFYQIAQDLKEREPVRRTASPFRLGGRAL